jgi:hypothetical protein
MVEDEELEALAAANPPMSGTVSKSQTMTLPFMPSGQILTQRTGPEKDEVGWSPARCLPAGSGSVAGGTFGKWPVTAAPVSE